MSLLQSSCRVAFAALLHDLGKFHERTGQPVNGDLAALTTLYRYSHAAHTGGMWDVVEKYAPDLLRGDVAPFPAVPAVPILPIAWPMPQQRTINREHCCSGSLPRLTGLLPVSNAQSLMNTTLMQKEKHHSIKPLSGADDQFVRADQNQRTSSCRPVQACLPLAGTWARSYFS